MRITNATWVAAAMTTVAVAVALWAWFTLPAGGGVSFAYLGLDGVRHHGVSRIAVWPLPLIAGFLTIGLTFASGLDGRGDVARAPEVFDATLIAAAGLLLVVEAALVGRALDAGFDVVRPVTIATGVTLLVVGNYLGKARRNWFIGLRTPWTLADAGVWDKANRVTGRGMFGCGLLLIALGLALRDSNLLAVAIGVCAALPPLLGVIYSWRLYSRLPHT